MPRRTVVTLEAIADLDNLGWAFWRAAQGKRQRPEVTAFAASLQYELATLRLEILALSVTVGQMHTFQIRDPKVRTIHAPCFRERVLHHAMMAQVGPVFERALVDDTFACRKGKGTLAAVKRVAQHVGRYPWHVHLDVRSFFASIDHAVLKDLIRRRIKGAGALALCDRVIDAHDASSGRGLPIGALTSQHFANLYLGGLDRLLLERRQVAGMVRYMDDVAVFATDKAGARAAAEAATIYAAEILRLEIKPSWQVAPSQRGLTFCGFRVLPHSVRLSRRRQQRFRAARRQWEHAFRLGVIDSGGLQAGYASARAITAHANAHGWHRADLRRHKAPDA